MATQVHTGLKEWMQKVSFSQEESVPVSFYLGLAKDTSLQVDDALSAISECDAPGYARQAIASDNVDWTVAAHNTTGRKSTAAQQTFDFTGGGDALNMWFLATSIDASGFLLMSASLTGAPVTPTGGGSELVTATLAMA